MNAAILDPVRGSKEEAALTPLDTGLEDLFSLAGGEAGLCIVDCEEFRRFRPHEPTWWDARVDSLAGGDARCAFLRILPGHTRSASVSLYGGYRVIGAAAGGWLLLPDRADAHHYWLPVAPQLRRCDQDGHVLEQRAATLVALNTSTQHLCANFDVPDTFALDVVVWRFSGVSTGLAVELQQMVTLETQPLFMWSSHTVYAKPADLYQHLVFGHVYENHAVWPRYWRVCSELDAHALYVSVLGLERSTGKRLYGLLRLQLVCAVMARQSPDGGWYHGEWTDQMESHFRLVAAGVQLLCAAFEDRPDPAIGKALRKVVDFVAAYSTKIHAGAWFLHDSLEKDEESIQSYPFKWAHSTVLGKSVSSMLVLNTHLDTAIAIDRYGEVTGDAAHADLVRSAVNSAREVLRLRTAEPLYRVLFWAIGLTFLPTSSARALPLPQRAVKRLAWKYLIPRLHRIKARFPRFVMPGGFIDRALVQEGCVVRYHPVNLMDIARFERRFGGVAEALDAAFSFTGSSGLQLRWKEARGTEDDSLGFWSEALYHKALQHDAPELRAWLAEAVFDLADNGLGISPSLLGSSPEALQPADRQACPSPKHPLLRVVNLSRGNTCEYLLVNPTPEAIELAWDRPPALPPAWSTPSGVDIASSNPSVPARSWLWGRNRSVAVVSPRTRGPE